MSKIEKIFVAIYADRTPRSKAAVERADYATTSEVIRTALREWELPERCAASRVSARKAVDEGIAGGRLLKASYHGLSAPIRRAGERGSQETTNARAVAQGGVM